nr:8534_t:CDS:2 [Entrophospora candida]
MVDYKDIKLRQSMWHTVKDHVRRVAKQLVQDEATYMEQLADFQDILVWKNYTNYILDWLSKRMKHMKDLRQI